MLTVLVVSGGGFQGQGLMAALRALDAARVVMVDSYADNPGRYFADAFHPVPEISDVAGFTAAVLAVAAGEGAGLVLPSTALELLAMAGAAEAFARAGAAVAVSDPALLEVAGDKRALHALLVTEGFPVLPMVDPRASDAPFPLVGKPATGWGSHGLLTVASPAEVGREWSRRLAEDYVWQRKVAPGRELSVDFAIDFQGRVSEPGVRARVRTSGGFAVVSDTVASAEAERWARAFAALARDRGGRGAFNLQFLEDGDGLHLTDVNPRIGTSAVHWRGTERDPVLHLCRSVDPSVSARGTRVPPRTIRFLGDRAVDDRPAAEEAALRGIVFDLDDTLVSHKRAARERLERLWERERAVLPARDAFLAEAFRVLEEVPHDTLFDQLAERFAWARDTVLRLIEAYRAIAPSACPPYPDVLPALATLRGRGYRLALLTDNPPASQRAKIAALGLAPFFDAAVFAREAGGEKPLGAAFAAAAAALGLAPSSLAMVGDNPYRDGLGALAAGYAAAYVIARPGTFFNFDPALYGALPGAERLRAAGSLTDLLARLPGPPKAR
jgi:FMN phosphatase YigB (HAD superfamily)